MIPLHIGAYISHGLSMERGEGGSKYVKRSSNKSGRKNVK